VRRGGGGASKTVLVSGAPDMIDEDHAFERLAAKYPAILKELEGQDAALDGKRGAKMWAVNVEIGEQSACLELTSPTVWDGIRRPRPTLCQHDGLAKYSASGSSFVERPTLLSFIHVRCHKLDPMNFFDLIWRGKHFINAPAEEEDDGAHGDEHDEKACGCHEMRSGAELCVVFG